MADGCLTKQAGAHQRNKKLQQLVLTIFGMSRPYPRLNDFSRAGSRRFPKGEGCYICTLIWQTPARLNRRVHTPEQRSFNMQQIKGKDIKPEMLVRKFI